MYLCRGTQLGLIVAVLALAGAAGAAPWRVTLAGEQATVETGGPLGLRVSAPAVVTPGGEILLRLAWAAPEGAPLEAEVRLSVSGGECPAQVTVGPAGAPVTWQAPRRPGAAWLEAQAGEQRLVLPVLVWPGSGPAEVESTLVDAALTLDRWMYWPVGATCQVGSFPPSGEEEGGARVSCVFSPGAESYVDLTKRTFLRGLPLELNLQARASAALRLEVILEDAGGQRFAYPGELPASEQWAPVGVSLSSPARWWGGAGDGRPQFPLSFLSLRLLPTEAAAVEVGVRHVIARTLAPAPAG